MLDSEKLGWIERQCPVSKCEGTDARNFQAPCVGGEP
jgi:hypothetical protein